MSTLEDEYIALSQFIRDVITLRWLLQEIENELNMDFSSPAIIHSTLFEDNNIALVWDKSRMETPSTRHIVLKYHFFRLHVGEGKGIIIQRVESK